MNCTLWFAFRCILPGTSVGWYSECTKMHGMRNIKNKAMDVWNYKIGFWCRYVDGPKQCGTSVREAWVSPCTNSIKNVCKYVFQHVYVRHPVYTHTHKDTHTQRHVSRIAKLGNRNPQQLGNNSCILILSLLTYLRLFSWHNSPWWTSASSLSRLHVHAQTHHTW